MEYCHNEDHRGEQARRKPKGAPCTKGVYANATEQGAGHVADPDGALDKAKDAHSLRRLELSGNLRRTQARLD